MDVENLIKQATSSKGKPIIIDANNFRYTNNGGKLKNVDYWRCSVRTCPAKILTVKSTVELVGRELPSLKQETK